MRTDHVDVFQQEKPPKLCAVRIQPGEVRSRSFITVLIKTGNVQRRAFVVDGRLKGDLKALYEDAKAGDHLLGKLTLGSAADKAAIPLTYILPPAPPKEDKTDEPKPEPKKLIDHQVELSKKLEDDKEKIDYLSSLVTSNPEHLPTLVAFLEALKPKDRKKPPSDPEALAKAADAILERVDEEALAKFYGYKRPAETTEAIRAKTAKNGERDALVAALTAKAERLLPTRSEEEEPSTAGSDASSTFERLSATTTGSPKSVVSEASSKEDFEAIYTTLSRWTEKKNMALLHARREQMNDRCVSQSAAFCSTTT